MLRGGKVGNRAAARKVKIKQEVIADMNLRLTNLTVSAVFVD